MDFRGRRGVACSAGVHLHVTTRTSSSGRNAATLRHAMRASTQCRPRQRHPWRLKAAASASRPRSRGQFFCACSPSMPGRGASTSPASGCACPAPGGARARVARLAGCCTSCLPPSCFAISPAQHAAAIAGLATVSTAHGRVMPCSPRACRRSDAQIFALEKSGQRGGKTAQRERPSWLATSAANTVLLPCRRRRRRHHRMVATSAMERPIVAVPP